MTGDQDMFEGYASLFGAVDLGRDLVEPGAFRESLAKRGAAGVKLLWQHDPAQPLGVWTAVREDARGLFVRGRLNPEVARAKELAALLRQGALDGLSIGYRVLRSKIDPATKVRRLIAVDLWEVSLVTFPLLPQARVTAVGGAPATPAAAIRAATEAL